MDISAFSGTFLPHLIARYVDRQFPLHALVDFELWRRLFPEGTDRGQFHWYLVSFTCNPLQDGTLLLTFLLPEPTTPGEAKFAAIRLKLGQDDHRQVSYYVLRKPMSIFDEWDIFYIPFSETDEPDSIANHDQTGRFDFQFCCKIDGTDSLRNFVFTVQQIPF